MENIQYEELKKLLQEGNELARQRLAMEQELFAARKLNLKQGNEQLSASSKYVKFAGIVTERAAKFQPVVAVVFVFICLLLLYMVIFKL